IGENARSSRPDSYLATDIPRSGRDETDLGLTYDLPRPGRFQRRYSPQVSKHPGAERHDKRMQAVAHSHFDGSGPVHEIGYRFRALGETKRGRNENGGFRRRLLSLI